MLKIILLSLSVSASPLVTRAERTEIKSAAWSVLYTQGAEAILSPEITKLKVTGRAGQVVSVLVEAVEMGPYEYRCTFQYDLAAKSLVSSSVSCE